MIEKDQSWDFFKDSPVFQDSVYWFIQDYLEQASNQKFYMLVPLWRNQVLDCWLRGAWSLHYKDIPWL